MSVPSTLVAPTAALASAPDVMPALGGGEMAVGVGSRVGSGQPMPLSGA
jgi:hypothetical protein